MADQRTAAERRDSAAARAWAIGEGMEVKESGRLPAGLVAAWKGAGSPPPPDPGPGPEVDGGQDDGPDWDGAAEQLGAEILDSGGSVEMGAAAAPEPAHQPDGAGPAPGLLPPPTSLEEARERLGGGRTRRAPPWARPKPDARPKPPPPPPIRVTKTVTDDITGKLTLLLTVPLNGWATVDPLCGGAAVDQLEPIVRTAVPLICLSQDAIRFFQNASKFMLFLAFAQAVQPVATAAYHHHLAGDSMVLPDGQIVHGQLQRDGSVKWPDNVPAQAAQQPPDYSQYATHNYATGHVPPVRTVS
jgi:hypothetical protein